MSITHGDKEQCNDSSATHIKCKNAAMINSCALDVQAIPLNVKFHNAWRSAACSYPPLLMGHMEGRIKVSVHPGNSAEREASVSVQDLIFLILK